MRKFTPKPRLGALLKSRGMTQGDLSLMTGIPQPTISRFDKIERFEIRHLFAIAHALNVEIADLFEVTFEDVPEK